MHKVTLGCEYIAERYTLENAAGSPYRNDSPTNPYAEGLEIYGD